MFEKAVKKLKTSMQGENTYRKC